MCRRLHSSWTLHFRTEAIANLHLHQKTERMITLMYWHPSAIQSLTTSHIWIRSGWQSSCGARIPSVALQPLSAALHSHAPEKLLSQWFGSPLTCERRGNVWQPSCSSSFSASICRPGEAEDKASQSLSAIISQSVWRISQHDTIQLLKQSIIVAKVPLKFTVPPAEGAPILISDWKDADLKPQVSCVSHLAKCKPGVPGCRQHLFMSHKQA